MGKRLSPDRIIDYLWDLFNNDPDLLKSEEEMGADEQQANAAAGVAAAEPLASAAQQGTAALKNLSQANAQDGTNYGELMALFQDQVRKNPRLLQDMRGAVAQNAPPDAMGALDAAGEAAGYEGMPMQ
jgi:hypothetical protein